MNARNQRHEGWTNYETWCVQLWIANDYGLYHYFRDRVRELKAARGVSRTIMLPKTRKAIELELAEELKEWANENAPNVDGMWGDLLGAALGEVNWDEIAKDMVQS